MCTCAKPRRGGPLKACFAATRSRRCGTPSRCSSKASPTTSSISAARRKGGKQQSSLISKPRATSHEPRATIPTRIMDIEQIDANRWRLPKSGGMRVDGIVYADETMIRELGDDQSLQQVRNVAHLPGIVGASLAMPDIHWGYGFPIGGVAATSAEGGVISPGGVGYDINCGVRLLKTNLLARE